VLETSEVLDLVARSTNVPAYGMAALTTWARQTGFSNDRSGIIGGYQTSANHIAPKVAELVLKIANGARAQDIPVVNGPTVPMFDWRELQHWGISESRLPEGSVVLFKQFSFWEQYRWRILGGLALMLIEAMLIVGLLIQRSRRARAEDSRRLSEEKFSKAFRSSPDAFVIARSSDGVILDVNERWQDLLGYSRADAIGRTTLDLNLYAVPSDREKFRQQQMKAEFVRNFETDIRTRNGEISAKSPASSGTPTSITGARSPAT